MSGWTCPVCARPNDVTRRRCCNDQCRHPGGPDSAWSEAPGKGGGRKQRLQWQCAACGFGNWANRAECHSCSAPIPKSSLLAPPAGQTASSKGKGKGKEQPQQSPLQRKGATFWDTLSDEARRIQGSAPTPSSAAASTCGAGPTTPMRERTPPPTQVSPPTSPASPLSPSTPQAARVDKQKYLEQLRAKVAKLTPMANDDPMIATIVQARQAEIDQLTVEMKASRPLRAQLKQASATRDAHSKKLSGFTQRAEMLGLVLAECRANIATVAEELAHAAQQVLSLQAAVAEEDRTSALQAVPCMSMAPAGAVAFTELQAALPAHLQASFAAWACEQHAQMQQQAAQQTAQAQARPKRHAPSDEQEQRVPSDDEGDTPMSPLTGALFQDLTADEETQPDDVALQDALAQAIHNRANLELSPTQPFGPALSAFPAPKARVCPYAAPQGQPGS